MVFEVNGRRDRHDVSRAQLWRPQVRRDYSLRVGWHVVVGVIPKSGEAHTPASRRVRTVMRVVAAAYDTSVEPPKLMDTSLSPDARASTVQSAFSATVGKTLDAATRAVADPEDDDSGTYNVN